MSRIRKELLIFGYVRKYCKWTNVPLLSDDLILLLIEWTKPTDSFDKTLSHKDIVFHPKLLSLDSYQCRRNNSWATYTAAVGKAIIGKGDKETWTIRIGRESIIGIMNTDMLGQIKKRQIGRFVNSHHKGYGLSLDVWSKYHNSDMDTNGFIDDYADQFDIMDDEIVISMELDMTQTKNKRGILSVMIHEKKRDGIMEIRIDGQYSNIVYDNIDITKKYRAVFAFAEDSDKWTELL